MKNSKQDELEIVYLSDEDTLLEQVRKELTPETTLTLRQWQQLYQLLHDRRVLREWEVTQ